VDTRKVVSIEDRIPKLKQQRKKKANRRLIMLLIFFFSLIAGIVYFQSPLSHVSGLIISGNSTYSVKYITSVTGITEETNIWKVDKEQIEGNIKKLPEIKSVKVDTKWPNKITISIKEYKRIAYVAKEKSFLPVLENGNIISNQLLSNLPINAPVLINFKEGDELKEMTTALEELPSEVLNSISEIHHTPKETDDYHITLYMNDGNEVSATIRTFSEKMSHYPSIIGQLDSNQKGIIDLEVGSYFRAYDLEGANQNEEEQESEE
jgi:cell division protein FtsQ